MDRSDAQMNSEHFIDLVIQMNVKYFCEIEIFSLKFKECRTTTKICNRRDFLCI